MSDVIARAGSTVITPREHGELAGYSARNGAVSTGTHDDLEATLVLLEHGDTVVGWLALDAVAVTASLANRLQRVVRELSGRSSAEVIVAASHTHSAPLAWTGDIHPAAADAGDDDRVAELEQRVADLTRMVAAGEAVPVTVEWVSAPLDGLATNRHSVDGPHDPTAGILVLRDRARAGLFAVLIDAAAHPTVLGPENLQWSADWPGAMRELLRGACSTLERFATVPGQAAATRARPTLLFLQGAAGDVSTRYTRRGSGFDEVARLGGLAGTAVLGAILRDRRPVEGQLAIARADVQLELRPIPARAEAVAQVHRAETALAELSDLDALDPQRRRAQSRLDGARIQFELADRATPEKLRVPMTAVRFGDLAWVHLPFEPFAEVGETIRRRSPAPVTRVIGYSDAYGGYLVSRDAERAGVYEALTGIFASSATDEVVGAAERLLADLFRSDIEETR